MDINRLKEVIEDTFMTQNKIITSKKINNSNTHIIENILLEFQNIKHFSNVDVLKFAYYDNFNYRVCKNCNKNIPYTNKYFSKTFCDKSCSAIFNNKNEITINKRKETNLLKYGVENPFQSKQIISTIQNKRNDKKDEISNKISNTLKNKDKHSSRYHLKIDFDITKEYLQKFIKNNKFDSTYFINETGYSYSMISLLKIQFGIDVPNKNNRKSKIENELADIIPGTIINNKYFISPLEIDVFSRENKLCIEYNGLLWHSFGKSKYSKFNNYLKEDKNKHLIKTELVEEKGYQLFHIFENEWLNKVKQKIWISIINNKLNKNEKIYARKCTIKKISSSESNLFLEENHLQGECSAEIRLGLYFNNELVQLMLFSKNKENNYELVRCCSKINTTIIGSKLLKYFEINYKPKSLICYANRRWDQSELYEKLNFKFINNTEPNYFYFKLDDLVLKSIDQFKMCELNKLELFDEKLTETEYMYNNGYRKIYDCGNKVYIKQY